ncbi:helix-turn-helix domain-containing protein [Terrisporobacter petrolearius]|uniref:helix-turn-helix domain-containing protein n=1 Tax=Terrisporobacter petrolearius TaxID=1460447 RepID=UPI001D168259|nr:helix-turn-helix domain-containing protein [Terrisporobacter petrolearius]MCC3863742.1 helix-turn-helix domain-containing protein [Terrisporobacter petrolearius]
MKDKQKIILDYIKNNKSQREIQRETGIARDTIRKYIKEYEERLRQAGKNLTEIEKADLIDDITQKPKYKSSPRSKQ